MNADKPIALALALLLTACANAPKPAPVAAASVSDATAPPVVLAAAAPAPAADPGIAAAKRDLKALGYAPGKPGDLADAAFQHALIAFEKDQGLAEDIRLTVPVANKLKTLRLALAKTAADSNRNAVFVYSDGAARRQALGLLMPPPDGLASDAPENFMQPLRPGAQASYNQGRRDKAGNFTAVTAIACHASRVAQANLALGALDTIAVDCAGGSQQWRATYSPKLGMVVRLEAGGASHDLTAIRPVTSDWPTAARTGLDWALTHALDTQGSAPVSWSSTGVAPHFEISASPKLAGRDAGLGGRTASLSCRRFMITQSGDSPAQFPGIACQAPSGAWSLPGSKAPLASPANGLATAARNMPNPRD